MSDFDFSEWITPKPLDESGYPLDYTDSAHEKAVEENYCVTHDLFNCWMPDHTPNTTDDANEAPVVEIDPREQKLNELMAKVEALTSKVEVYENTKIAPINDRISEIHKGKKDAKKVYDELVRELDKEYSQRWQELNNAKTEFRSLQSELNLLRAEQQGYLKSLATEKLMKDIESRIDHLIMDSSWGVEARPYQLGDLKYMIAAFESGKTGVLNANPTGAGKTFESIIFDACMQHMFPARYDRMPLVLWVTIPSLIKQTVREIKKWNPGRYVIPIEGSWDKGMRERAVKMAIESNPPAMIVCNYEQFNTNPMLKTTEWDIVIADEVSKLKGGANPGKPTQVWRNFKELLWECTVDRYGIPQFKDPYDPTPRAKFFMPLSGTPIQNKPGDMWAYLHLFKPISFPKLKNFEREYAYGWPEIPVKFDRLIDVMKDQVVRHPKAEILPELPPKVYEPREVELGPVQRKIYDQMKNAFFAFLDSKGEQQVSSKVIIDWIINLWEIALFPGMFEFEVEDTGIKIAAECQDSAVLDEAEEIIDEILGEDEKVVVFSSWFNKPLFELKRRLVAKGIDCALYTGEQNTEKRDAAVMSFQSTDEGSVKVLLCNMKAAGYGLNLQGNANQAIMLDQWWNPSVQEQAEDRLHRMGQKNTVIIHQLSAVDTVYDFINAKAEGKRAMASSIMESKELKKSSDWRDYLEGMI